MQQYHDLMKRILSEGVKKPTEQEQEQLVSLGIKCGSILQMAFL